MSTILDGLNLKVERAEKHLADFKTAVGVGSKSERSPTTHTFHINIDRHVEYTADLVEPGPQAGIILGDMIHQLRSCLDHLACELVFHITHDPADRELAQFPIFETQAKFEGHKLYGFFKKRLGEPSPQFTAIKESQPYERHPHAPTSSPLYILRELDNIDKHRTILVINPTVSYAGFIITPTGDPVEFSKSKHPVKAGANVLDLGGPLPQEPVSVKMQRFAPYIVLSETGVCDNLSVFPIIRGMINEVRSRVSWFGQYLS